MSKINLPSTPQEATKIILKKLPTRRMRDVLEKRFGLKNGRRITLEAIGKEYKITRERVRQIEADALKHLGRKENLEEIEPVFAAMANHLNSQGGVMAEHHLLSAVSDDVKNHPHVSLLLGIAPGLKKLAEDDNHHVRWTADMSLSQKVEGVMLAVAKDLNQDKKTVSRDILMSLINKNSRELIGGSLNSDVWEAYLATSKVIASNPYGEYGLTSWPAISPRGIKDKAFVALNRQGKAMHFLEIAKAINQAGWSKKKAHPQTVHNELIKDQRFVLVGRGLYALREWGYEPGVVRDVLVSVLKKSTQPMTKEEIIKSVMDKRFVKAPTILLNLQNKSLFKKNEEGKYSLV